MSSRSTCISAVVLLLFIRLHFTWHNGNLIELDSTIYRCFIVSGKWYPIKVLYVSNKTIILDVLHDISICERTQPAGKTRLCTDYHHFFGGNVLDAKLISLTIEFIDRFSAVVYWQRPIHVYTTVHV